MRAISCTAEVPTTTGIPLEHEMPGLAFYRNSATALSALTAVKWIGEPSSPAKYPAALFYAVGVPAHLYSKEPPSVTEEIKALVYLYVKRYVCTRATS
jgi:hypothetical protein